MKPRKIILLSLIMLLMLVSPVIYSQNNTRLTSITLNEEYTFEWDGQTETNVEHNISKFHYNNNGKLSSIDFLECPDYNDCSTIGGVELRYSSPAILSDILWTYKDGDEIFEVAFDIIYGDNGNITSLETAEEIDGEGLSIDIEYNNQVGMDMYDYILPLIGLDGVITLPFDRFLISDVDATIIVEFSYLLTNMIDNLVFSFPDESYSSRFEYDENNYPTTIVNGMLYDSEFEEVETMIIETNDNGLLTHIQMYINCYLTISYDFDY